MDEHDAPVGVMRACPLWLYYAVKPGYERVWCELASLEKYGKYHTAFPSLEALAKKTGLSRATVERATRELKKVGAIEWVRTGRSNTYRVNLTPPEGRYIKLRDQIPHIDPLSIAVEAGAEAETTSTPSKNSSNSGERAKREYPKGETRADRLLSCWRGAYAQRNAEAPDSPRAIPRAVTFHEAQEIAHALDDTIDYFPDNNTLISEIRRIHRCFYEKEWTITFKGVMKNIGQTFDGTSSPTPVNWKEQSTNGKAQG